MVAAAAGVVVLEGNSKHVVMVAVEEGGNRHVLVAVVVEERCNRNA